MAAAASLSPVQNSVVEWVTPKEQECRFEQFCPENKGGNLTNWKTVLERLNLLPEDIRIQAFPSHLYSKLDKYSLFLIPPGTSEELVAKVRAYVEDKLGIHDHIVKFNNIDDAGRQLLDEQKLEPANKEYQWLLISDFRDFKAIVPEDEKEGTGCSVLRQEIASFLFHEVAEGGQRFHRPQQFQLQVDPQKVIRFRNREAAFFWLLKTG